MIIGSIWINDTMAYIVGSLIGKTPLSAISPKKTWEGTIGGIILAIGVMGGIGAMVGPDWNPFSSGTLDGGCRDLRNNRHLWRSAGK